MSFKAIQIRKGYLTNLNPKIAFVWVWNWFLTLREICRLRVFKNRVLRKTPGPKRDDVTGE